MQAPISSSFSPTDHIGPRTRVSSLAFLALALAASDICCSGGDKELTSMGIGGFASPVGAGGQSATERGGSSAAGGSSAGDSNAAGAAGGNVTSEGGAAGASTPTNAADGGQGGGFTVGPIDAAPTPAPDARSPQDPGGPPVGPEPDSATRMKCTGTNPISCHFGGQPGNYDVTAVLGGAAAGTTAVSAEALRGMLNPVTTAAGQTQRFSFTVNVRQPEGEPIQAAAPAGTPGLDVYFSGTAPALPQLLSIGFAPAAKPFMVYVAGDSTVCDQGSIAFGGWGQQLPKYFNYPVSIANYADSGESSGSFLGSSRLFGAIEAQLKPNDWVLIQFGHNDKTVTAAAFHANMTSLVTRVKAKGGSPVLVTPVARAQFNGTMVAPQHINGTGANLPVIVKQVGTEQNVPVLDLTARTVTWLTELGPRGWQAFHANGTDVTHTNPAGADVEAGFVRDLIKQANLTPLVERLR